MSPAVTLIRSCELFLPSSPMDMRRTYMTRSSNYLGGGRLKTTSWLRSTIVPRSLFSTATNSTNGIELHYDWLTPAKGANSKHHVVVFLHGLLGNGRNLRTMAKKMCEKAVQPGLLLDLRGHGNSVMPNPQTSTFDVCVQDLQVTFRQVPQITKDTDITLVGHSWGGRVALQYAYNALHQDDIIPPKRIWLLDTVPGNADKGVARVVDTVTQVSSEGNMTDRKDVTDQLMKKGIDQGTAQWLASSLKKKSDGSLEFGFDLTVANDLLPEFQKQDFVGKLQYITREGKSRVDLVRGGKNKGWTDEVMESLEALEGPNFSLHVLPNAGHWMHVEDLPGLVEIVDVSN